MRPYELIHKKRDGGILTREEIEAFLSAYTEGSLPDYQAAAMLMAIFFRGMNDAELGAWTRGMLESGDVLDLSDLPGRKVDKHSTGGVGDKVSIPLAPLVVACGVPVPMISGRGLGHTGGTLDKLEAIPGFRVDLDVDDYRRLVGTLGVCLIGQTSRLAPADKKLYALRDATATVESIPLIASSIMSKKLAEGIDALVLDVKVGRGAFMKNLEDARTLARTMVGIGKEMGKQVVAHLTDMSQPLGRTVGNALEVRESIELLRGEGPPDLVEITLALGAEMLVLGQVAASPIEGRAKLRAAIADGSGFRRFCELVEAQGGDRSTIEDPAKLPNASRTIELKAPKAGFITGIECQEVGLAAMALGAGRAQKEDTIDPAVGFVLRCKVGDEVKEGQIIAIAHVNGGDAEVKEPLARLVRAYEIGPVFVAPPPLLVERIA